MKVRSGFVSNSSSSSFIAVAAIVTEEEIKKILENHNIEVDEDNTIYDGIEYLNVDFNDNTPALVDTNSDNLKFGFYIAQSSSDSGGMNEAELSIEEFSGYVKFLGDEFNIDPKRVKIFIGEESC